MNKVVLILKIIFTAVTAFLLQNIFPWWSASVAAFLIGFILYTKPGSSFLAGFLGIAILWFFWAFWANSVNDGILATRVAAIFSLPNNALLLLITSLIGGLVGGFGAMTGSYLRNWLLPREN
jgi:hypothetical protein